VLQAGDFVYHPPQHIHDFMEYSDDIEIFELASPADHSAIDV
jgi:mannose-6-phosphate isomerase-like protein (cupin superfamily)